MWFTRDLEASGFPAIVALMAALAMSLSPLCSEAASVLRRE